MSAWLRNLSTYHNRAVSQHLVASFSPNFPCPHSWEIFGLLPLQINLVSIRSYHLMDKWRYESKLSEWIRCHLGEKTSEKIDVIDQDHKRINLIIKSNFRLYEQENSWCHPQIDWMYIYTHTQARICIYSCQLGHRVSSISKFTHRKPEQRRRTYACDRATTRFIIGCLWIWSF